MIEKEKEILKVINRLEERIKFFEKYPNRNYGEEQILKIEQIILVYHSILNKCDLHITTKETVKK